VIKAEKRGIKIDLDPGKPPDWTLHQQLEIVEQRRRDRIA
jgi:hypothetical protein